MLIFLLLMHCKKKKKKLLQKNAHNIKQINILHLKTLIIKSASRYQVREGQA